MCTNKKWYDGALLINRDPNWYRFIDTSSKEAAHKSLKNIFLIYKDTKITDVLLGVLEQTALLPTEAFHWRGDKYLQKIENGHAVDYSEDPLSKLYKCFVEYGIDAAQIFIDTMREIGIRPWLSLRMNDIHFSTNETSFLRSDMYYEADKAGEKLGPAYAHIAHCFDFKYPRYRTAILGYIAELLDKYDIFGLELDFMREIFCFDYKNDPECHKIMTEYIREIKKLTDNAAIRVGHDVKLMIRTCRDPEDSLIFGFDIKTLCDEGIIDAVVPTPRWSCTDSAVPVKVWRELLGDDIAIFGGIETLGLKQTFNMPTNSKAYAAAFYAGGADGIYFNNHENLNDRNRDAWMLDRAACHAGSREFVVTWQDTAPAGRPVYRPLPLTVDGTAQIALDVGKINSTDKVKVIIDFEGDAAPTLTISGNTARAEACEALAEPTITKSTAVLTEHSPYLFHMDEISTDNGVVLEFAGNGTIYYINMIIEA